ncbi:hypothetical protein [Pseudactinotalea suaedae]|uniref:hypothetical protein n=1 Tax=Pseudactinotalea suaedae TaxID=1524924 RepID=UPI0012E15A49|nr:hypothetical protein [Pseudactinotalea suaedae]
MLVVEVPDAAWMSANHRVHWAQRKRRTQWLRKLAWALANNQHVPTELATPVTVVAYVSMPSRRAFDPNNANPTTKAMIDGLTDHGCWPDDKAEHVLGPDHRLGPVTPGCRVITLHLIPAEEVAA